MRINRIVGSIKTVIGKSKQHFREKQIQRYFKIDDTVRYTDAGQQIYETRHGLARYAKANDMFVEVKNWKNPRHNYSADLSKLEIRAGKFKDPLHNNYLYYSVIVTDVNKIYSTKLNENSFTEDNFLRRVYRTVETLKSRCSEPHKEEVRVFNNIEEAREFIQSLGNNNTTHTPTT